MIDPEQFGYEWERVCQFFGVPAGRREAMAKEYGREGRKLELREFWLAIEETLQGRALPTLGEWNQICYRAKQKRQNDESMANNQTLTAKAAVDFHESRGCRGGDCHSCHIVFCASIAEHATDSMRSIRHANPDQAVSVTNSEMKRLAVLFKGVGFEKGCK